MQSATYHTSWLAKAWMRETQVMLLREVPALLNYEQCVLMPVTSMACAELPARPKSERAWFNYCVRLALSSSYHLVSVR